MKDARREAGPGPGDSIGRAFVVATYGESHGDFVGAVIDGCPAGVRIDADDIQRDLDRRRPGAGGASSARDEPDKVEVVSGIVDGKTSGGRIELRVANRDARPSDYDEIVHLPRPGHGDLSHYLKHGHIPVGGGRYSGRETVGRVLAGAVARWALAAEGIFVNGRVVEVHGQTSGVEAEMARARENGDSVGGIVEVVAEGVPAGLGQPVFDKLDADLAKALMSIGSVKGVEIGAGFSAARMLGSECNDPIVVKGGKLATATNNAGGMLAGVSDGMPVVCRIAVKPASSIALEQETVDLRTMRPARLSVKGRHDTCICPRIVVVAEAMAAITIMDHLLRARGGGVS